MATFILESPTTRSDVVNYTLGPRRFQAKPHPAFGGRKVLEVYDEPTYAALNNKYESLSPADDLIEAKEAANLQKALQAALAPLVARVDALEGKTPGRRRKKEPDG